jgi:hypothetical protein
MEHDGSIVIASITIGIGASDSPMSLVGVSVKIYFLWLCVVVAARGLAASVAPVKLLKLKRICLYDNVQQRFSKFRTKGR